MKARTLKKLIVSLLAAALLLTALLVPSFAQTDAEKELEAANAQVAACEQNLQNAKSAYAEAQRNLAKGTYGFFQASGSTAAVAILDNAKYKNLIAYGTVGDATSLDNVEAALQLIDAVNDYRAGDALDQLLVTDSMVAMAEADADAYYDLGTAPKQFTIGGYKIAENLGTFANAKAAADSWYSEKTLADQHPEYLSYTNENWSSVGHYFNMSRKNFQATGAAVNTRLGNKFCQVYYGSTNGEKAYTTAQYRERINAYKASLDEKKKAVDDAEAALANAKAQQTYAQGKVDGEKQAASATA